MRKLAVIIVMIFVTSGCGNSMAGRYFNKDSEPESQIATVSKIETQTLLDDLEVSQIKSLESTENSVVYSYDGTYNYELSGDWRNILTDFNNGALNIPTDLYQKYSSSYLDAGNLHKGTYIFRNYNDRSSLLTETEFVVGSSYDIEGYNVLDYFVYEADAILSDDSIAKRSYENNNELIINNSQYTVYYNENWQYRNGKLIAREYFNSGRYIVEENEKVYIITRTPIDTVMIDVYSK